MAFFSEALEVMFPYGTDLSIGEKVETLNKNLFLNEFLYNFLDNIELKDNKMIIRNLYGLNDEFLLYDEK